MKDEREINLRLSEIELEIQKVDKAIEKELSMVFLERRNRVLRFLDFQKKYFAGLRSELIWVLNKPQR